MAQESQNIKERNITGAKEPGKYNVIFHNDDFTPMDFVTLILKQIFFKNDTEAISLMMKVHLEGSAIVASYSYDIAVSKANEATHIAQKNGFPLRISVNKV